jgi:carboxylesterase type B
MARLFVALAAVAMVASTASGAGLLVQTTSGPVMGMETEAALTWRGIPYATPPVGSMRWQDSVPPTPWTEPREAFAFGPACPQKCELPPTTCQPLMDEDCLFLNVYSPIVREKRGSRQPRSRSDVIPCLSWLPFFFFFFFFLSFKGVTGAPVMVFFHGGRYEQGSTGVELYDGQLLANITSAVVVTANYRIGALGFMTLGPFTGNFGVKDQRLTLEWVQANIRGFGGDPTSVTIFGQSAGGTSVSFHLVAPKSFPLYHRAVVQSSPFSLPVLDLATAQLHYAHLANETQCKSPDPQCLLEQTWFDIVAAQTAAQQKIYPNRPLASFYPWIPHVDGQDLTSDPLTMFQQGSFNRVPIMAGHVFQEGTL